MPDLKPMETLPIVIDTHWTLDLWAFDDPRAAALRAAIAAGRVCWLACAAMRAELARVLAYPRIAAFLARRAAVTGHSPERATQQTLAAFDRYARLQAAPPIAPPRCRDPDDQVFIDLALAHRALLLSRDRAVLALARPLRAREVCVQAEWPTSAVALPTFKAG
ncbi:MAG: PIN domain-containing protein [Burkholderiaceae bacterium]|jgi:predicted nucleic acid-binding protein|nr:PIN domain-containing protein [Burkholderiaceae bacterium]